VRGYDVVAYFKQGQAVKGDAKYSYTWKDANTLELALRYIESPHSEIFTCHFESGKLNIEVARSFSFGKNKIMIEAVEE